MLGEDVFLCYTSYVSIQAHHDLIFLLVRNRHATGSSFPAVAHKGLLSLLVFNWVFFPCWCFTYLLISYLPWQAKKKKKKKKKKWALVMKHINWVGNHQAIITAKYGSHHFTGMEKMQFNHFPHYKSMGAFCCHGNQTKRQITVILAILHCPNTSNICTNSESYCISSLFVCFC